MKSHSYDFLPRTLLQIVGPPLVPFAIFVLAMHGGAALNLLPKPCPALDTDRTILFHQAEASLQAQQANLILVGDSSCLMDVAVEQLNRSLPPPNQALNLGTLSYLDLGAFRSMVEHYVTANPDRLRTVVLLMNPEALRRAGATEYHLDLLRHYYQGTDFCGPTLAPLLCGAGVEIFRGRFLSRAMPQPLSGAYGRFYGFTHDLWDYLSAHGGSAIDPGAFDPASLRGSAEYRLAASLEKASREFRAVLPRNVKLFAGITPLPESVVGNAFRTHYDAMLKAWSQWLGADVVLTDLPATLADNMFASGTHLNQAGVRFYTEQVARALADQLPEGVEFPAAAERQLRR
jgi:hypothetical protein